MFAFLLCWDQRRSGAWFLALSNIALAAAQFAELVLFGRIIDALAGSQKQGSTLTFLDSLLPPLAAWAGFGLFHYHVRGRLSPRTPTACRIVGGRPS